MDKCKALIAGSARAPAVASLAASLTFELASVARAAGEAGAAAYCSSLTLPALRTEDEAHLAATGEAKEGAAAALAPPGPELVALEEYLLGLPEWKDLNSEVGPGEFMHL